MALIGHVLGTPQLHLEIDNTTVLVICYKRGWAFYDVFHIVKVKQRETVEDVVWVVQRTRVRTGAIAEFL